MEIRKATELDRNDIAFIYADAFSEDWKQLSTDIEKMTRALRNGHILNNYIVAVCDERGWACDLSAFERYRAFHIPI